MRRIWRREICGWRMALMGEKSVEEEEEEVFEESFPDERVKLISSSWDIKQRASRNAVTKSKK